MKQAGLKDCLDYMRNCLAFIYFDSEDDDDTVAVVSASPRPGYYYAGLIGGSSPLRFIQGPSLVKADRLEHLLRKFDPRFVSDDRWFEVDERPDVQGSLDDFIDHITSASVYKPQNSGHDES